MLISKKSLSLLIENFLKEEEEKEDVEKDQPVEEEIVLQDLKVEHDGVTAEIKVNGDRHDVYINGKKTQDPRKEVAQKVAIVAKAYQNIKFDVASGSLTKTGLENILTWADTIVDGGRQSIIDTEKSRLAVGWHTQIADREKNHERIS
tara:strand:+ start:2589 stop:3032 length:444 start_codon:yes stop_codon:yes gene_type:complete